MKFGKLIQSLIDNALPTWKDKFLAYKYLKKRLNSLLAESIRAAEERHGLPNAGDDMGSSQVDVSSGQASVHLGDKRRTQMHEQGRIAKRRHLLDDAEFRRLLEEEFKRLLDGELDKMNEFVVDKEEEFVIKLQVWFLILLQCPASFAFFLLLENMLDSIAIFVWLLSYLWKSVRLVLGMTNG